MTDKELKIFKEDYKIFWGRIHGKTYSELIPETEISLFKITNRIRKFFPYLRRIHLRPSLYKHLPRKISNFCLDDLLAEGFSQSEIAKTCSCSRQAISDRLKRRNISYFDVITDRDLKMWRKYTKVYWMRIQGFSITDIQKITKVWLSNWHYEKIFPELKTIGLGHERYIKSYVSWFNPDVISWQTKACWYKIQGLTAKEVCRRLNKSEKLIAMLAHDNPEIKLKAGCWKKL